MDEILRVEKGFENFLNKAKPDDLVTKSKHIHFYIVNPLNLNLDFHKKSILHNLEKLKTDLKELNLKKDFLPKETQINTMITSNYENNINKLMILLTDGFKPKPNLSSTLLSIYEELNILNYDNSIEFKPLLTYQISDGIGSYFLANSLITLQVRFQFHSQID